MNGGIEWNEWNESRINQERPMLFYQTGEMGVAKILITDLSPQTGEEGGGNQNTS